ncbi:hypothetical protein JY414_21795, partial [Stenotrophomonas maltophilia]|nr:hypothetical protein [Stenotrophomonas maltophilia]MBN5061428.1 hypothetical protein [Stenotrophomonas maltophilia]MBN5069888.1 hypothetical protein [Stenotrophomonas maltophilia]
RRTIAGTTVCPDRTIDRVLTSPHANEISIAAISQQANEFQTEACSPRALDTLTQTKPVNSDTQP